MDAQAALFVGGIMAIVFAATFVRSALGFGDALIALPLLTWMISIRQATPLMILVSATVAALILFRDWRKVDWRAVGRLLCGAIAGVPLGAWYLRTIDESLVKSLLAVLILGISAFSLLRPRLLEEKTDRAAPLFGFLGGLLGGAYNTAGPATAIYGAIRRWSAGAFRANIQAYFVPTCCLAMAMYAYNGLWTRQVSWWYVCSLPGVLAGVGLGGALNHRLRDRGFDRVVYVALLLIALLLLASAVWPRAE